MLSRLQLAVIFFCFVGLFYKYAGLDIEAFLQLCIGDGLQWCCCTDNAVVVVLFLMLPSSQRRFESVVLVVLC